MAPYESGATGDDYVTLEAVHIFLWAGNVRKFRSNLRTFPNYYRNYFT